MREADEVSCASMLALAAKEHQQNSGPLQYQTEIPMLCARFQELANREEEHKLQKSLFMTKNMCFEKNTSYNLGVWDQQFRDLAKQNVEFDAWTRRKLHTSLTPIGASSFGSASGIPKALTSSTCVSSAYELPMKQ